MSSEVAIICLHSRTSSWTFLTTIRGHSHKVMSSVFFISSYVCISLTLHLLPDGLTAKWSQ